MGRVSRAGFLDQDVLDMKDLKRVGANIHRRMELDEWFAGNSSDLRTAQITRMTQDAHTAMENRSRRNQQDDEDGQTKRAARTKLVQFAGYDVPEEEAEKGGGGGGGAGKDSASSALQLKKKKLRGQGGSKIRATFLPWARALARTDEADSVKQIALVLRERRQKVDNSISTRIAHHSAAV
jgi:hypothetical protein